MVISIEYSFIQRVLNATYVAEERKQMSEEKETLESLFGELEHSIEELKSQIGDAQYEVDEAYSKIDYAKDYVNGCDSRIDEVETLVSELRNRTGEFTTAKAKRELTKLIDILLKQQAKIS